MTWPTIWQFLTILTIVDNFYSCWYNYDNYWNFLKIFTTKSQQHEQRQWQRQSWDNSDNWETEFMTIFVAWQLRVTLDSIRNSCDVFHNVTTLSMLKKKNYNLLKFLTIFNNFWQFLTILTIFDNFEFFDNYEY